VLDVIILLNFVSFLQFAILCNYLLLESRDGQKAFRIFIYKAFTSWKNIFSVIHVFWTEYQMRMEYSTWTKIEERENFYLMRKSKSYKLKTSNATSIQANIPGLVHHI